jgi:hypothetical protein
MLYSGTGTENLLESISPDTIAFATLGVVHLLIVILYAEGRIVGTTLQIPGNHGSLEYKQQFSSSISYQRSTFEAIHLEDLGLCAVMSLSLGSEDNVKISKDI